jgi:hypothetical protein
LRLRRRTPGLSAAQATEPAQKIVRVGFVSPFSASTDMRSIDGFWQRLRELGWIEGQNVVVEAHWVLVTWAAPGPAVAWRRPEYSPTGKNTHGDFRL